MLKTDNDRFTSDFNQMLLIIMINSMGFFFIGFWIPIIARMNMAASAFQISLVVVSWTVGRMINSFITGFIVDRTKSRTRLVLIGSFGRATSYFITYTAFISNQIFLLGIGHFTLGFFAGFFWIPINTLIAYSKRREHLLFLLLTVWLNLNQLEYFSRKCFLF